MRIINPFIFASPDTTADGKQAFLMIGDSIQVTSDAAAPTPTAGVLFEWNGSAVVNVTTDLAGANLGTQAPQFANSYFSEFARKSVFINKCSPGSEYSPNGDNNNWSTTGTLYADAVTETGQCLSALGLTKLKAIFVCLGINDASGAVALATIRADMDSLYSRLIADFPGIPILVMQIGSMSAATPVNARSADLRRHTKQKAIDNADVHLVAPLTSFRGAGHYDTDMLHLKQTGNNAAADMRVRWFKNSAYSKWARSIISSHFDELSTNNKSVISVIAASDTYAVADMWLNLHTSIKSNVFLDFAFMAQPLDAGFDFAANDCITTNPTGTKGFITGYIPSFMALNIAQNDMAFGVKVKSNSTAAGTAASIMACTATAQSIIEQTTTPGELYRINDATLNQHLAETSFQSDSYYEASRNSNVKTLNKNGAQLATATVASTGFTSDAFGIGCRHASGSISNIINASFEYAIVRKASTVTVATSYTDQETARDNWI